MTRCIFGRLYRVHCAMFSFQISECCFFTFVRAFFPGSKIQLYTTHLLPGYLALQVSEAAESLLQFKETSGFKTFSFSQNLKLQIVKYRRQYWNKVLRKKVSTVHWDFSEFKLGNVKAADLSFLHFVRVFKSELEGLKCRMLLLECNLIRFGIAA